MRQRECRGVDVTSVEGLFAAGRAYGLFIAVAISEIQAFDTSYIVRLSRVDSWSMSAIHFELLAANLDSREHVFCGIRQYLVPLLFVDFPTKCVPIQRLTVFDLCLAAAEPRGFQHGSGDTKKDLPVFGHIPPNLALVTHRNAV